MIKSKSLTDVTIRNLQPGDTRREVPDPGAPGLYVVIQPSGVKSFAVRYTLKGGKSSKLTLGRWVPPGDRIEGKASAEPKVGDAMSLGYARKLAADVRIKVRQGRDPAGERRGVKEERRAAEANTFRTVADEFFKRKCGMKIDAKGNVTFDTIRMRSGAAWHATLERLVCPVIGETPISDIKRKKHITALLDKIEDGSGAVMADRVLAILRAIMNWHATKDEDYVSPIVRGMARTKPKERARKRILTDDEIRDVWTALDNADLPTCYPAYIRSLLLTATRRNEAADMSSSEIEDDLWTIPGERYKTKLDHVVPLTQQVRVLIGGKPNGTNSSFVFSTTDGTKPFSGFSKAKKELDAEIARVRKREERLPMPRWTLHDLRRTARSLMSRAKVPADHAERAIGHVIGGVRETYDRYEYLDEKRAAFEALGDLVDLIVDPKANKVIQFPKAVGAP
ncbi:site-specific integrase [Bradyrhizobium sp. 192]|uniref:tyrosine-type recombinase/integrase n=1 Tax=Bradyrhizobium sp. 192 TaxID=2782660 RepID=UPI001FFE7662|nr:site-specific integrase [Bradyrhizobium sp. 192]UPJ58682.1 integrase arm-type DNA-binding domain-containing protein [Bradyrhizobium sp. 192]